MRATEFLEITSGRASSQDEGITHLERLPKREWDEKYLTEQDNDKKLLLFDD